MSLSRWFRLAGLAGLLLLGLLLPVWATILPLRQPVALRVAGADSVVIGKVVGFDPKPISAGRFAGDKNKAEYSVAIVKIEEAYGPVTNIKRIENVRVGFIPTPPPPPPVILPPNPNPGANPQPILRPTIRPFPAIQLVKDQEVCLFLTPHHEANFYTFASFGGAIVKDKDNPQTFTTAVDEVKLAVRLLANPKAGLESKKTDERLLTAGLLLTRYRTPQGQQGPNPKQESIDAAESKAILTALAEADWTNQNRGQLHPQALFFRLNLTAKDGWTQPANFQQFPETARQWLKDNADKYRIQRFVAGEKSSQ